MLLLARLDPHDFLVVPDADRHRPAAVTQGIGQLPQGEEIDGKVADPVLPFDAAANAFKVARGLDVSAT